MKIISFLGTSDYSNTVYVYEGKECNTNLFPEALYTFFEPEHLAVFVTKEAEEKHWATLQQKFEANGVSHVLQPVRIPLGRNENELWQIFDQLTAQIEDGEEVVFDITNALRSIPVLVFIATAYLRSAQNAKLKAITYGAFEAKEAGRTPVFDLSPFVNLLDWLNASDQFIRTGNATSLAGLLRQSKPKYDPQNKQVYQSGKPLGEAAGALDDVSLALRLILPDRAMEASEKLQTKMGVAASSIQKYAMPFTVLAEQVSATYTPLALPNPRSADNVIASLVRERNLIEWYLQRNQIVQAVSVAREWLVSWGMIQVGYRNLYDKSKRTKERLEGGVIVEGIEEVFGKSLAQKKKIGTFDDHVFDTGVRLKDIPQINEVLDLYNSLGRVRNILTHAGKQSSDESAKDLETQVRKFCNQLKQLPLSEAIP